MFQQVCGLQSLPGVVLATTMWGELQGQSGGMAAGERREGQLKATEEFWGGMLRGGGHTVRHTGDRKSAEAMLSVIIKNRQKITLDIQTEMCDRNLSLDATTAGQYLRREYADLQRKYEIEAEELQRTKQMAIEDKDEEMLLALNEEKSRLAGDIARTRAEDQNLKLDFSTLREEKSRSFHQLAIHNRPPETMESANPSIETELLTETIEQLQRSIEEHKSERLRQERKLRAKAKNASAENAALTQIVQRLDHDNAELERLVRTRWQRQRGGGSQREMVVVRKREPQHQEC